MGIRFHCPQCQNRLHVKSFLAGKRGVCPKCGAKVDIPFESESGLPDDPRDDPDREPQSHSQPARHTPIDSAHAAARAATLQSKPRSPRTTNGSSQSAPAAPKNEIASPVTNPTNAAAKQLDPKPPAGKPSPTLKPAASPTAADERVTAQQTEPAAPTTAAKSGVNMGASVPPGTAMPDPLLEAPQSVWYVRPPSGGQFGPARADIMQRWIDEGRVTADTLVWREGWADWRLAADVLPKFRDTAATAPVIPVPSPLPAAGAKVVPAPAIPAAAAATVMRYQKKKRERRGIWTITVILLSVLAVALIVMLVLVLRRS